MNSRRRPETRKLTNSRQWLRAGELMDGRQGLGLESRQTAEGNED